MGSLAGPIALSLLATGCSAVSVLANLAAVVVCLLAVVGAVVVLFGSITVYHREGERVWRVAKTEEPDDADVLARVVTWACSRRDATVTGSEVLRVIRQARQSKPADGERGRT